MQSRQGALFSAQLGILAQICSHTLASRSRVRLVRASACRSRRWKSLGAMMAGEKKRRHRKLVTAMNGTFWRRVGERRAGFPQVRGSSGQPFLLWHCPVSPQGPCPSSRPWLLIPPQPPTPAPRPPPPLGRGSPLLPSLFLLLSSLSQPGLQRAHLMLGAGELLSHAPKELAEGGSDHRWACANRTTECTQKCPQVGAERLCALLQHLCLGLRAV